MPFSGNITWKATLHRGVAGALNFSGAMTYRSAVATVLAGIVTFAGNVTGKLSAFRSCSGGFGFTGTLTRKLSLHRTVTGVLSFAGGEIVKGFLYRKTVAGVLSALSGALAYAASQAVAYRKGGYRVYVIGVCNNIAAAGEGAVFTPDDQYKINFGAGGVVQAKLSGTATVEIQGRLNSDFDWLTLASFTATGVNTNVKLYPQMRYNVTSYTSGTISMGLGVMLMSFHHRD
jgi:hypothetical protein